MRRVLLAAMAAACLMAPVLVGQEAPPAAARKPLGPPQNLKILKPEEVPSLMGAFMNWTGLKCVECHAAPDFASDEKDKKVVARRHLKMVRDMNANIFGGENKVTCYTCHRGDPHPLDGPPMSIK